MGWFSDLFKGSSDEKDVTQESSGDTSRTAQIWFSKEHVGRSSGELETDGYRSVNGEKTEKISHNQCEPVNLPIRKED